MRLCKSICFSAITLLILTSAEFAQSSKPEIEEFAWLSGCWEQNDLQKKQFGTEQWMKPAGQTMIGMSRTVKSGKTVSFEYLRIVQNELGVFYISKPNENSSATAFKLIKSSSNQAVFENASHDFPQRIIYRRDKTSLFARIEGSNNGKSTAIDFPMVKVKCG